jgi:predicted deacylase
MVKRRAKHPLEDNPFIEGFLEWMDAPEGQQSIQALDQVFDALEHAGVDARHRKIVWADGKRLSIEQSVERIHAKHPGVPRYLTKLFSWVTASALLCREADAAGADRVVAPPPGGVGHRPEDPAVMYRHSKDNWAPRFHEAAARCVGGHY